MVKLILLTLFLSKASLAGSMDAKYIAMIRREAIRQEVNPDVAVAVAKAESSLNPKAVGSHGEIGLFQIMPENAPHAALFNPKTNIRIGVALLKKYSHECEDMGEYWMICYNQGSYRRPHYPFLHPYYKRIIARMN